MVTKSVIEISKNCFYKSTTRKERKQLSVVEELDAKQKSSTVVAMLFIEKLKKGLKPVPHSISDCFFYIDKKNEWKNSCLIRLKEDNSVNLNGVLITPFVDLIKHPFSLIRLYFVLRRWFKKK